MLCKIFYESWQMDCCGAPFSVGDRISWTVNKYDYDLMKSPVEIGTVDYCYEAHLFDHGPYFEIEGTVNDIMILYEKFEPQGESKTHIAVSGVLKRTMSIERNEEKYDGMRATGFIITVDVDSVEFE